MTERDNILKAILFEKPDYIPIKFHINDACWHHYDQGALQDLIEEHSFLFPDFKRQKKVLPQYELNAQKDQPYTDAWGCTWKTTDNGIIGSVKDHPLSNWDNFENYTPPDPNKTDGIHPIDWEHIRSEVRLKRGNDEFVCGGLPHGHTFLRLQDIRGFENLIFDMHNEDPKLKQLIKIIEEFNYQYIINWIELKPDMLMYPDDLGMQVGPMISPNYFRKYIKPVYQRIMKPARDAECIIHMHCDGDIRTLAKDLIDDGINVINLQDLVNDIGWISDNLKGRICIDLDIDQQKITPHGTPKQIDDLIREEASKLGSKQGGLMMSYALYPGIPLKNIRSLMNAMEKYSVHYPLFI